MRQHKETRNLIIVTVVFLNIGLVPMLLALAGFARLVVDSMAQRVALPHPFQLDFRWIKVSILCVAGLLAVAGGMAGHPEDALSQKIWSLNGYALFIFIFIILVGILIAMSVFHQLNENVKFHVKGALLASILIAIRTVYGLLGVFLASGPDILTSIWSPLFGSAWAFSFMALVPEYFALLIFIFLAWHQYRTSKAILPLAVSDIELPPRPQ